MDAHNRSEMISTYDVLEIDIKAMIEDIAMRFVD